MEKWSAECYKHYKLPPVIVEEKGIVRYLFHCKK
jgi:hypothetical protein